MVSHPEVLWAQRSSEFEPEKNLVYLTISVADLDPSYKLTLTDSSISFSGHPTPPAPTATASAVEPKVYEFNLDFFAEVEKEPVRKSLSGKNLSLVLKKKEAQEDYWPRLTKEKVKLNFVKTDFGKWKDQDEQEDIEPVQDEPQGVRPILSSLQSISVAYQSNRRVRCPSQPPGGGMGGMGGMPGMGGMGGMGGGPGGFDMEALMAQMKGAGGGGEGEGGPGGMDFAKMMASMGPGGAGGAGGDAEEEEDDDEDDGPPRLEAV